MRMRTMIALVLAVLLILAGGILFVCTMATLRWDFTKLSTIQYETNTYVVTEDFQNITIDSETADILLLTSYDGTCRVVCDEETDTKYIVEVVDGTLTIEFVSDRSISDYIRNIGINLHSPKLTICLPQAAYKALVIREDTGDIQLPKEIQFESVDVSVSTGDITCFASVSEQLKIETDTGSIRVENVSAGRLDLTVSTGDVRLENVHCDVLHTEGNTGDILLKNVIATETISIIRTTGDVRFDGADAASIFVETDTGGVIGTLLTEKVFLPQSDTGDIEVPKTSSGGKCEIITSNGDIKLTIQ